MPLFFFLLVWPSDTVPAEGTSMRMEMAWVGLLITTGCVRTAWYKQGVTQSEFSRESYECERDARQSGYFGTGVAGALNMQDFVNRCMVAHGYELRRVDEDGNLERTPRVKPTPPSGPDAEALAEERRTAAIIRREQASPPSDAGTPVEKAKFGRCTEDDMRGMLKQGLSSSAINSACFE